MFSLTFCDKNGMIMYERDDRKMTERDTLWDPRKMQDTDFDKLMQKVNTLRPLENNIVIIDCVTDTCFEINKPMITSNLVSECFAEPKEINNWYIDMNGDLCQYNIKNHTECIYRMWKLTKENDRKKANFLKRAQKGMLTRDDLLKHTKRIGTIVGRLYGWKYRGSNAGLDCEIPDMKSGPVSHDIGFVYPFNLLNDADININKVDPDMHERINAVLLQLDERLSAIAQMYYLRGWPKSYIADAFNISMSRVGQLQDKLLHCIKLKEDYILTGIDAQKYIQKLNIEIAELTSKLTNLRNKLQFLKDKPDCDLSLIDDVETYIPPLSIDYLNISPRVANILKRYGVHHIAALSKQTWSSIKMMQGVGNRGLKEIEAVNKEFNLNIKDEALLDGDTPLTMCPDLTLSMCQIFSQYDVYTKKELKSAISSGILGKHTPKAAEILNKIKSTEIEAKESNENSGKKLITINDISANTCRLLYSLGIRYFEDLANYELKRIDEMCGTNRDAFTEILSCCINNNIMLK